MSDNKKESPLTRLLHSARHAQSWGGALNAPVMRASTIAFDRLADYDHRPPRGSGRASYGISGTTTHFALQEALSEIEGAADCITLSSGLAAVAVALQVFVEAGDHVLVADSVYFPCRRFCNTLLKRFGVETTFYDPRAGAQQVEALIRPNTKLLYMEAPGSMTFEMQDLRALVALAKKRGLRTAFDNTWASPFFFRPLELGVDLSIQAGTKYLGGHADLMLGYLAMNEEVAQEVIRFTLYHGHCCGPEEAYQGLRGLRTLGVRMKQHYASALEVATWLEGREEVERVLYPPLESDPGHALWKRDFDGGAGLFGVILKKPYSKEQIASLVEGYRYFEIGASWGSYASLCVAGYPEKYRVEPPWQAPGPLLRYHIGLEDPKDLIADLEEGFRRLAEMT